MLNTTKTVRYTATLPSDYIDELTTACKGTTDTVCKFCYPAGS